LGYFDLTELDTNCVSEEKAFVVTRDFVEYIILSVFNGLCVSNAVDFAKKTDVLPMILSIFSLKLMGQ